MIITAGLEAARLFLSSEKEGKSLAPIQQVDRGGEIVGPDRALCDSVPDCESHLLELAEVRKKGVREGWLAESGKKEG